MRLTLISTIVLAASTMVSAAPYLQERATSCTVVSGVCGKGNGNGATGACCTSSNDCKDTCTSSGCGVSDGTKAQTTCPAGSSTTTTKKTTTTTKKTTTTTKKSTTTTTTKTTTKNTTTTTKSTASATATSGSTCKVVSGVCGKKSGNGATGACCSSNDDCQDTCNSTGCGVSDGTKPQTTCASGSTTTLSSSTTTSKVPTTTTTKTTTTKTTTTKTTATATATSNPGGCTNVAGVCGEGLGNGATGACCTSSNDCQDTCNSSGCGVGDLTKAQTTCPAEPPVTTPTGTYIAQKSPVFPSMAAPSGVVTSYDPDHSEISDDLDQTPFTSATGHYPTLSKVAETTSDEAIAAYNAIDWSVVPNAPVRTLTSGGDLNFNGVSSDPYCWWSYSNCVTPKIKIPSDISRCDAGTWGLTYDDGPFNLDSNAQESSYAEPTLYNYLAENGHKADLFYIGSNVYTYPAAARRALNDGYRLCVHTWSHNYMTTLTNKQVVSELYYAQKAIKQATGVTPKCWRPPYGDVDDRVRSIAWQMGMRTVLWNADTNDWNLKNPVEPDMGGTMTNPTADKYIQGLINNADTNGYVVLEHELDYATVNLTMTWLPKISKAFKVQPATICNGVTQPYWEENFDYSADL
ncbi:carbohydrate esterase family 4 protein [Backusella circina FSU 941]|nr:carbohydrate esterase family 4 protein [Backusella circina FSU 941]